MNGTRRQKLRRKEAGANSVLRTQMENSRDRAIRNSRSLKQSWSHSHSNTVQWLTVGNAPARTLTDEYRPSEMVASTSPISTTVIAGSALSPGGDADQPVMNSVPRGKSRLADRFGSTNSAMESVTRMSNKKPAPLFQRQSNQPCPVCGAISYSRAGIHPQCASKRADAERMRGVSRTSAGKDSTSKGHSS